MQRGLNSERNALLHLYLPRSMDIVDGGCDAAVDIAGDFPGSPVRLTFHFEHDSSERITKLTIRP